MKSLALFLALLSAHLMGYEVKMRLLDEAGNPVVGAMTKIIFIDHGPETVHVGSSDLEGRFSARGQGTNSVMLKASKADYYAARVEDLSKDKNHDVEVIMPRILKPISLYAWRGDSGGAAVFPVKNEWVGFDFEAADWVAPYGKGKTIDVLFRFKNEFKGWKDELARDIDDLMVETKELAKLRNQEWTMDKFKMVNGKWDGDMEVSFPNEGDGIFEEKRFLGYSQLKMPHEAPTSGYLSTYSCRSSNYNFPGFRKNVGFFLRTRVKRNERGEVISANFSKIVGDIQVMAPGSGFVRFSYYFNPTPNDRNLEFDPKKNLFPRGKPGANVYDP
jgi:hypothetical protein